jgi:NADPH-dependent 2,4-dienoyl-CoA reductase/sulfur reductase-like enzyme/peroxiredoxin family protein/rhodanese-related sulfurtransferase/TusA-related sulfurtransferase
LFYQLLQTTELLKQNNTKCCLIGCQNNISKGSFMSMKVVIIGGVAGGATAAARLRRLDENASITLLERGEYISYANCGLPYYIGGIIRERDRLFVQTVLGFESRFRINVKIFSEAIRIDRANKVVEVKNLKSGEVFKEPYDKLILSPGAEPLRPPIKGINDNAIFTLRNVPDTDSIKNFIEKNSPRHAVIVGAGFIGLEMAENLHHQGMLVTIIELADQVMAPVDFDMAALVHQHLKTKQIEFYLNDGVSQFERISGKLYVKLKSGKSIPADMVVLSIGIKPDSHLAKEAGLTLGERGSISVNGHLQTSDPDIYAAGDVIEYCHPIHGKTVATYLAGPANKQGRIVADNIVFGNKKIYGGALGTAVAKVFDLTVATTGLPAKVFKKEGIPCIESTIHLSSHAGYYPDAMPMSLKLVFEPVTGKIFGAQAVGYEGIDKRIDAIAALMRGGATVRELTEFEHSYAPPYSSAKDPVNVAGYVAENILNGLINTIQWHEIESMTKTEGATLIDVRITDEFELGTIPGSINIPLDDIRTRMAEIPKDRKCILYCGVGLRAYLGCRILMQNGYDNVHNLSGGYKTWEHASQKQSNEDVFHGDYVGRDDQLYKAIPKEEIPMSGKTIEVDACGLQCPGPIMKLKQELDKLQYGDIIREIATDPGFARDVQSWCNMTGHQLVNLEEGRGKVTAIIRKVESSRRPVGGTGGRNKSIIIFSDDMDKALASFVIANGALSSGNKVTLFFTFWGLNVIKKRRKPVVKKDLMGRMFGWMMPGSSLGLNLSKMGMMGMGRIMMRFRMRSKGIQALEEMIDGAIKGGAELIACQMSMDVMGVDAAELIDGVKIGGVATYLDAAEQSNLNLFI